MKKNVASNFFSKMYNFLQITLTNRYLRDEKSKCPFSLSRGWRIERSRRQVPRSLQLVDHDDDDDDGAYCLSLLLVNVCVRAYYPTLFSNLSSYARRTLSRPGRC